MATQIIPVVAPALLPIGQNGPFVTPSAVQLTSNGYVFTFTNGADWPTDGSHVMDVTLEHFAGGSWHAITTHSYAGVAWVDKLGNPLNTSFLTVGGDITNAALVRMSINVLQAITLGWGAQSL